MQNDGSISWVWRGSVRRESAEATEVEGRTNANGAGIGSCIVEKNQQPRAVRLVFARREARSKIHTMGKAKGKQLCHIEVINSRKKVWSLIGARTPVPAWS